MMDGWVFLGVSFAGCVGLFLSGLRFAKAVSNPWAGKKLFGQPVSGGDKTVGQVRRIGWFQMAAAVAFFVLTVAMSFGLLGPVDGIRTINVG